MFLSLIPRNNADVIMYKIKAAKALEDIRNNSVCKLTKVVGKGDEMYILNTDRSTYIYDILQEQCQLVLVSNLEFEESDNIIPKGYMCRYIPVTIDIV